MFNKNITITNKKNKQKSIFNRNYTKNIQEKYRSQSYYNNNNYN